MSEKKLAIFAHWDKDNLIEDYVVYYVKALKEMVEKLIFVSDCDIADEELKKLENFADIVIAHRHGEYDFGSYKKGYLYAFENNLLDDFDELILANDSCYAPIFPFSEMFNTMAQKNLDFWGVTTNSMDSKSKKPFEKLHIQSYFLVFTKKVFLSDTFKIFINSIKPCEKKLVIKNYEMKLTGLLANSGFKYGSFCKPNSSCEGPPYLNWKKLIIQEKVPFLKTAVVRLKSISLVNPRDWKKQLKKNTNYDTTLIDKDLVRNKNRISFVRGLLASLTRIRKRIIKIHLSERKIYIFNKQFNL